VADRVHPDDLAVPGQLNRPGDDRDVDGLAGPHPPAGVAGAGQQPATSRNDTSNEEAKREAAPSCATASFASRDPASVLICGIDRFTLLRTRSPATVPDNTFWGRTLPPSDGEAHGQTTDR
jgi:hypothetical protein